MWRLLMQNSIKDPKCNNNEVLFIRTKVNIDNNINISDLNESFSPCYVVSEKETNF